MSTSNISETEESETDIRHKPSPQASVYAPKFGISLDPKNLDFLTADHGFENQMSTESLK